MRNPLILLMALSLLGNTGTAAGETPALDNLECTRVLEHWAGDPKGVPSPLVDQCRQQLAAAPKPAARSWPAPGAGRPQIPAADIADPCSGPDAASSVLCWGPWAALPPAAGPAPPPAPQVAGIPDYEPRPELAPPYDPEITPLQDDPPLPLDSCAPGTPCGFATVVPGATSNAPAEDTRFAPIKLAPDGTGFVIDPDRPGRIDSVTDMIPDYLERPDEFKQLEARGHSGDEQSALYARTLRDADTGELLAAADIWTHGNRATRVASSGYFAWGNATTQAGLDALTGRGAIVSFSGPMSVDNRTVGSMTLDFGTRAQWSGNWVNPAYTFSAGGPISGVNLNSDNGSFSANVLPGSVVQGALLGEPGNQSITHIIDVNLADTGLVRDVGLLRQDSR